MARKDFPHLRVVKDGETTLLPAAGDELDKFLGKVDDPDDWRTLPNEDGMGNTVLSREELDIIYRIQQNEYGDGEYDPYEPYVDFFSGKLAVMPVTGAPEPKRRFVPSKWEAKKIMKIVRAIRKGWIIPSSVPQVKPPRFYNLWSDNDKQLDDKWHVPPPKEKLPDNAESYNPPEEYLLNAEELEQWNKMDPEDRPRNFLPKKFSSLRSVPAYTNFIQERFSRCLDLYLCPRIKRNKLNIDPESLIPKLPDPKELKPFPITKAIEYKGHLEPVKSISVDPNGQWLLTGSDDKTVKLFEVATGRCHATWEFDEMVSCVIWNPSKSFSLFSVSAGSKLYLIDPLVASERIRNSTFKLLEGVDASEDTKISSINWEKIEGVEYSKGFRFLLNHSMKITNICWHRKGDYFATVLPDGGNMSLLVHQVTKKHSQPPLKKIEGILQKVLFHPVKPLLVIASQKYIRIYDLIKQELFKKLQPGVQNISSLAVHGQGDNIIIGSFDEKVVWFDLDYSSKPYKTLRFHKKAVRNVAFHQRYPLFASCSDDGSIHVLHGMVYQDLMQNPLIIPVKILRPHKKGVSTIEFHPNQPWIFSAGEGDNSACLCT